MSYTIGAPVPGGWWREYATRPDAARHGRPCANYGGRNNYLPRAYVGSWMRGAKDRLLVNGDNMRRGVVTVRAAPGNRPARSLVTARKGTRRR